MKVTLNLDDDAHELLKQYAYARAITLGKAASELIRRGITAKPRVRIVNGLTVFDLPSDSPRITTERVKELESELE